MHFFLSAPNEPLSVISNGATCETSSLSTSPNCVNALNEDNDYWYDTSPSIDEWYQVNFNSQVIVYRLDLVQYCHPSYLTARVLLMFSNDHVQEVNNSRDILSRRLGFLEIYKYVTKAVL